LMFDGEILMQLWYGLESYENQWIVDSLI